MNTDNLKKAPRPNKKFISLIIIGVSIALLLTLVLILKTSLKPRESEVFVSEEVVEHSCRKPLIIKRTTEIMSCSNFKLNKTEYTYGDTMEITYDTNENVNMSNITIRRIEGDGPKGEWSIDSFYGAVSTGSNAFSIPITQDRSYIPHNNNNEKTYLTPGQYEIGVVTYDKACTKQCGILEDGTLYTSYNPDDPNFPDYTGDFEGVCPAKQRYDATMGMIGHSDCSNTCYQEFKIKPKISKSATVSGQVYCQDPGGTRYPMKNVDMWFYNDITKKDDYITTDDNGNYSFNTANIDEVVAVRVNSLGIGETLPNGQLYSALNQPTQAINCQDNTNCSLNEFSDPHCGDDNASYEHCVLDNIEKSYSNFDFAFTNCEPTVISEKMSCANFQLNKSTVKKGELLSIKYDTVKSMRSDVRIRYFDESTQEWGDWSLSPIAYQTNESSPHVSYEVPQDAKLGKYELSVIIYDEIISDSDNYNSCNKMCGVLNNGRLYTKLDDYDGLCPTEKYYTPDMGFDSPDECFNDCRQTFEVVGEEKENYCNLEVVDENGNDVLEENPTPENPKGKFERGKKLILNCYAVQTKEVKFFITDSNDVVIWEEIVETNAPSDKHSTTYSVPLSLENGSYVFNALPTYE